MPSIDNARQQFIADCFYLVRIILVGLSHKIPNIHWPSIDGIRQTEIDKTLKRGDITFIIRMIHNACRGYANHTLNYWQTSNNLKSVLIQLAYDNADLMRENVMADLPVVQAHRKGGKGLADRRGQLQGLSNLPQANIRQISSINQGVELQVKSTW